LLSVSLCVSSSSCSRVVQQHPRRLVAVRREGGDSVLSALLGRVGVLEERFRRFVSTLLLLLPLDLGPGPRDKSWSSRGEHEREPDDCPRNRPLRNARAASDGTSSDSFASSAIRTVSDDEHAARHGLDARTTSTSTSSCCCTCCCSSRFLSTGRSAKPRRGSGSGP
jgi:hypothetical protein